MKYLVSVEARYVIEANSENAAKALALAATASIERDEYAFRMGYKIELRGSDVVCITEED